MMKKTNIASVILLILLISCNSEKPDELEKFEHFLFSIEFPKSWTRLDAENMTLSIVKYNEERADNISLDVSLLDSAMVASEQEINLKNLAQGMKKFLLSSPEYVLVNDLQPAKVNGSDALTASFNQNFKNHTVNETYYYLYNSGFYITFILKTVDDYEVNELKQILKTVQINKVKPLNESLN